MSGCFNFSALLTTLSFIPFIENLPEVLFSGLLEIYLVKNSPFDLLDI